MKMKIYSKIWVFASLLLFFMACSEDDTTNSTISQFQTWSPVLDSNTPAVVADEIDGDTYTFTFFTDSKQFMDATLTVGVGPSSTAVEGVDFEIVNHDVSLLAFEGNEGFDVTIQLLQDYVVGEDDETIYLTFSSGLPTGVVPSEVLAVTIRDSGVAKSDIIDFQLSWEFVGGDDFLAAAGVSDACEIIEDWDMTIYPVGSGPYNADDLLGYGMASLACPEAGSIDINDMVEGDIYNVWIILWGGVDFGSLSGMNAVIDYNRDGSFSGQLVSSGYSSTQSGVAYIPYYMIRTGDDVAIYSSADDSKLAEGRQELNVSGLAKYEDLQK